jgi:hypothetical protein
MLYLPIVAMLSVLIALILANELVFHGALFPSRLIGGIGGLCVLAAAFGVPLIGRYRGQGSQAVRHLLIWAGIIALVMAAYWLLG